MADERIAAVRRIGTAADELAREAERIQQPMLVYLLSMVRLEVEMIIRKAEIAQ